jgi:hypothetical protein
MDGIKIIIPVDMQFDCDRIDKLGNWLEAENE